MSGLTYYNRRSYRERLTAQGLCFHGCGNPIAVNRSKVQCEKCLDKNNEWQKNHRRKYRQLPPLGQTVENTFTSVKTAEAFVLDGVLLDKQLEKRGLKV